MLRQVLDPAEPRRAAEFDRRLQHPVQRDKHRHLHQDRQAAAQRIDLLGLVQFHRGLVHLGRVVLVLLADGLHFRRHQLDLGHALVTGCGQREERQLDQDRERDDGPAPVAQHLVQLVHDPEDRLGDDGQHAVVFHQLQAGGDFFQQLLILRAGIQLRFIADGGAWRNRPERHHGADGVQVGVDLLGENLARDRRRRHERRHEEVLRHGDPAITGLGRMFRLTGFDLGEVELLVVFSRGVQRRAGVAAVEVAVAKRLVAVVGQLHVQRWRHWCCAGVGHVVAHADGVVAALEGEGLGQLDAALLGLEHQLHFAATVDAAHARLGAEARIVVRDTDRANQAGLGQVGVVGADIEQHLVGVVVNVALAPLRQAPATAEPARMAGALELEQFETAHDATGGIDVGLHHIGGDGDDFRLERFGRRRGPRGGCRGQRRRLAHAALGGGRRLDLGRWCRRQERLVAVRCHPRVPQQEQRYGKHNPQDGTFIDFH